MTIFIGSTVRDRAQLRGKVLELEWVRTASTTVPVARVAWDNDQTSWIKVEDLIGEA